jgi:hypothetical protein
VSYRLLTPDQLALKWGQGWNATKITRLVRETKIPHIRMSGPRGRIYFHEPSVDAWIKRIESPPVEPDVTAAPSLTREEERRRLGIPVHHMFAGR